MATHSQPEWHGVGSAEAHWRDARVHPGSPDWQDERVVPRVGRARPRCDGAASTAFAPCRWGLRRAALEGASQNNARGRYSHKMSRQALGNVLAGVLFLIVAIVDFTRDSSGIGVVFVVFATVFLGLGLSDKKRQRPASSEGDT
jgi:hypothetical protein